MIELTIGVLTFLRDEKMYRCVETLQRNVTVPFHLHVADQGRPTPEKTKFYNELQKHEGFRVSKLPFNFGIGKSWKHLFDSCETDYYLMLADDTFPRRGSVKTLLALMKELLDVRIVAPVLWEKNRYRYLTKKFWIKDGGFYAVNLCRNKKSFKNLNFERSKSGIRYIMTNYTAATALYQTSIRHRVNWDPNTERVHVDFFLQFAQTSWKAVTSPDAIFDHEPEETGEYKKYKRDVKKRVSDLYVAKKWGLKAIRPKVF